MFCNLFFFKKKSHFLIQSPKSPICNDINLTLNHFKNRTGYNLKFYFIQDLTMKGSFNLQIGEFHKCNHR